MTYKTKAERDAVIETNLPLVVSRVKKLNKGVFDEDLFQSGTIGLIQAADRFDESRGFAFSTYAVSYIDGYIMQCKIYNKTIKPSRGKDGYRYADTYSLENTFDEDGKLTFDMVLSDGINMEDEVTGNEAVRYFLNNLKLKERLVAELSMTEGMTQKETAKNVGVSQAHVSRIKRAIYRKYVKTFGQT